MSRGWRHLFSALIILWSVNLSGHPASCANPLKLLSSFERAQLGKRKSDKSQFRYTSDREWIRLRKILVERSTRSNPLLDPTFTAYTPGETLQLMKKKKIHEWHEKIASWKVPPDVEWIVFVPCAKTKPWDAATIGLYGKYNQIRALRDQGKIGKIYFVTISEPLGVVPEAFWRTFQQYDNPGLFSEDVMRSGLMTADWPSIGFPEKRIVPFDPHAYDQAIQKLASIIARFIQANSSKKFISFVEDFAGVSTHSDMLTVVEKIVGPTIDLSRRFTKRPAPRQSSKNHILKILSRFGLVPNSLVISD